MVEKNTIFGKQTISSVMGTKLGSLDELEETIKEYDKQKMTD